MQLVSTIHRAYQIAASEVSEKVEGISHTQAMVLLAIAENPGTSQTKLVEATGVDRSTLADVVRRLLVRRLVARKRTKEDARAYAVTLTDAGAEKVAEIKKAAKFIDAKLRAVVRNIEKVEIVLPEAAE